MRWTLPNILTTGRLLAAPAFALVFLLLPRPLADQVALVLFVLAAVTDFFDGYLARRLGQESAFGRMLDPIADKAMVVIALSVVLALSGLNPWILVPITVILFREVFVSGLREYLGAQASALRVTKLAKWKTTIQMVAIPALLLAGIFQARYEALYYTQDPAVMEAIQLGEAEDTLGLLGLLRWYDLSIALGLVLIWSAGILTALTGWDYFRKAVPLLREQG